MNRDVLIVGRAGFSAAGDGGTGIPATDFSSIDFSTQIANRSDLRAQGLSQLMATYTAGHALDDAGLKGNMALLERTDLFVATSGGERDEPFDEVLIRRVGEEGRCAVALNRELVNLRPSLFLTQLQNLFAANISIAFGVLGTSITFMGGADAGARAVSEAHRRIETGMSNLALVGGVFNGARSDVREFYAAGLAGASAEDLLRPGEAPPLGCAAAFLVLEAADHAEQRGRGGSPRLAEIRAFSRQRFDDGLAAGRDASIVYLDTLGCALSPEAAQAVQSACGAAPLVNPSETTGALMEAAFPFLLAQAATANGNSIAAGEDKTVVALSLQADGRGSVARLEGRGI